MKLLTTQDNKYLLWVSEETADRERVWVYYQHPKHKKGMVTKIVQFNYSDYKPYEVQHIEGWGVMGGYKKLLAYLPLTPDAAPLEGVPLLPPLPYRVGDNLIDAYTKHIGRQLKLLEVNLIDWFAASGERKYSEKDVINLFLTVGYSLPLNVHERKEYLKKHLQSLSPAAPLPVAFEPEYYYQNRHNDEWYSTPDKEAKATKYKTITLPNGQEQLVGGYKYKED